MLSSNADYRHAWPNAADDQAQKELSLHQAGIVDDMHARAVFTSKA